MLLGSFLLAAQFNYRCKVVLWSTSPEDIRYRWETIFDM